MHSTDFGNGGRDVSNKPKSRTEWLLQIEALANEAASEDGLGQLEDLLQHNPEARIAYAEWSQLQIDLGMVIQAEELVEPVLKGGGEGFPSDDRLSAPSAPLPEIDATFGGIDSPASGTSLFGASWNWLIQFPSRVGLFAGAAMLLVGIVAAIGWHLVMRDAGPGRDVAQNEPPKHSAISERMEPKLADKNSNKDADKGPATIGRIHRLESQVLIERGGAKQLAVEGMEILATDSLDVLADGSAELTMADQSRAVLGPSTMLAFSSASEAVLQEGFLQIDARHRLANSPLAIATSNASAQIQDARLSMGAARNRTQIRVSEGSVLAVSRIDGQEVTIPEGYSSTISRVIAPGPRPSRSGHALLVVSTKSMALVEGEREAKKWERFDQVLADRILGDRLWRSATPVRVRTYAELRAEDFVDCAIVVLSVYPLNAGVEQKLANLRVPELPIPVVCLETTGFPVLGLTGNKEGSDFGFSRGPFVVDIVNSGHPLAAGIAGSGLELFAFQKNRSYGWGRPAESALKIAHVHDFPNRWMLFAYEQGDSMARGTATARRVGLFIIPAWASNASPGFDLIDAAIDWCLDSSTHESRAEMVRHDGARKSSVMSLLGVSSLNSVLP